jgi:ribosome recycling factor
MITIEQIKTDLKTTMAKSLESLKYQLTKIRTGRASASLLDGVVVDYYGTPSPLKQLGQVSTPEARLLQIQPFDKTMIAAIEKAIMGANLGVTPSNDGNVIRIPFPALTEERRKEQVKEIKKLAEDARIALRNLRRDENEKVKKAEKAKEIGEDDSKKWQTEIQTITDQFTKDVDKLVEAKEKELLTL